MFKNKTTQVFAGILLVILIMGMLLIQNQGGDLLVRFRGKEYVIPPIPHPSLEIAKFIGREYRLPPIPIPPLAVL